jgi:hypothetical protein
LEDLVTANFPSAKLPSVAVTPLFNMLKVSGQYQTETVQQLVATEFGKGPKSTKLIVKTKTK